MIIRQTTTIVFEYPQDYLQEQEWCKTKEDRWIHKSTDTIAAVYENTISYSIGQPSNSEKPNNCEDCRWWDGKRCHGIGRQCNYEPKDEPQTEDLQDWKDRMWAEAVIEPQTERSE